MIITSPTSNSCHLIIDETDLENNNISLNELIANPKHTIQLLSKLLENDLCSHILYANIFTYKFKIFYIEVFFNL
jgi:hypothetical protein